MLESKNIELDEYVTVADEGSVSFGGSQTWFPVNQSRRLRNLHLGACGLIASADFFLIFARKNNLFVRAMPRAFLKAPDEPMPKDEYLAMIRTLSHISFPIFPRIGAFSFEVSRFLNHYFRKMKRPERLSYLYLNTEKRRDEAIRKQLEAGYPVPLIIGQHFFHPFSKKGVHFYSFKNGHPIPEARDVYRHFVNITGIYVPEDASRPLYYEISSWGKKYYIDMEELDHFIKKESAPWLTSVFVFREFLKTDKAAE